MRHNLHKPLILTIALTAIVVTSMLGLYQSACAQQQRGSQLPFSNSVEQRNQMVRELSEIKELLREQNALLRTLVSQNVPKADNANSLQPASSLRGGGSR